ncbi:hypothetical protein LPJ59_000573, partial [Coemansia sp. RSA 2399]
SIAEVAQEHWHEVRSGWYDFDARHKLVEHLHKVTKEDVLRAWDKYFNPETATESYTRVDHYAWSQRAWIPQSNELAGYPEGIIALNGCLQHDGVANATLVEVADAVAVLASGIDSSSNSQDSVYTMINALYHDASSMLKSKVALDMAVDQAKKDAQLKGLRYRSMHDYSETGMLRTPDGTWLIGDVDIFKSAQSLDPLPKPVEQLIPKYSD